MTAQDRSPADLSPSRSDQDRSAFVSVAEAARRLGVSTATVKRRIRDGTLEAEPLSRPQGIEYRVRLPRDVTPPLTEPASDVTGPLSHETPPPGECSDSEPAPLTGSAHVTTQDVSAAITAAVAPLAERLAVQDATIARQAEAIERQAGEIAELRENRGRLTAELTAARDQLAALATSPQPVDASTAPASPPPAPEASAPWWKRWRSWLAVGLVVAVVGSASCQASASTKHAGLCTSARATMDFWANALKGQPLPLDDAQDDWAVIESAVRTAERTC